MTSRILRPAIATLTSTATRTAVITAAVIALFLLLYTAPGASGNQTTTPLTITGPQTVTHPENATKVAQYTNNATADQTILWSLEHNDQEVFTITGGNLAFSAAPDHENPSDNGEDNSYQVTVVATATGDQPDTAKLAVTITVEDVNEPPFSESQTEDVLVVPGATTYADLNNIFKDPEGDVLSFTITAPRDTELSASLNGVRLTLTASGEKRKASIAVTASDRQHSTTLRIALQVTKAFIPPTPVTNLQAQPTLNGFILTWDPPTTFGSAGTHIYFIYYSLPGEVNSNLELHHPPSTTYELTGLEPQTLYVILVAPCSRQSTSGPFTCSTADSVRASTLGPPTLVSPIQDWYFNPNDEPDTIDLSNVFEDPNNDPLLYRAHSSNTSVVTETVSNSILTLTPRRTGTATITTTATDNLETEPGHYDGREGDRDTFTVTVGDLPTITITPQHPTRTEGQELRFTLTANPAPTRDTEVKICVSQGNADYLTEATPSPECDLNEPIGHTNRVLVKIGFPSGSTSEELILQTENDTADEADATITATILRNPGDPYTAGTPLAAMTTVADNDDATSAISFAHANYLPEFYIDAPSRSTLPHVSAGGIQNPSGVTYAITELAALQALASNVAFDPTTRVLSGTPHSLGTAILTLNATTADGNSASTTITINVQNKLAPPTNLDVKPIPARRFNSGISRAVQLTWTASANSTEDTIYNVYVQEEGNPPRQIATAPDKISDPAQGTTICLDDADCHRSPFRNSEGLGQFAHFNVWVTSKQQTRPVSLASSNKSETVRIVPGPITTIDGNAKEHGQGNAQVRWTHPQDATGVTIRWRPLQEDSNGNSHDQHEWILDEESLPPFANINLKYLTPGSLNAEQTVLITGLEEKTIHAVQLNYNLSTGTDSPDLKVFSGVDHYVYPSDEPPNDGDRMASIPLNNYLQNKSYAYVFCQDTFPAPSETWLNLIRHAMDEWIMATDELIQAPRLLTTNGNPATCADYDSHTDRIITETIRRIYERDIINWVKPTQQEIEDQAKAIIQVHQDVNLKSNTTRDKALNEVRMIQDERYSGHIEPATFLQIAAQTGFNATCLKNEFIACAIRNRQHRTTDIYIKRSKVMPQAGEQLSTDHFPGTDTIWNHNDIQFNHCRESSITFEQQRGHTYHILMHEIGHALGLHGGEDRQNQNDSNRPADSGHPNPSNLNTIMRQAPSLAYNCSPHPLDIAAIYAIYQTAN